MNKMPEEHRQQIIEMWKNGMSASSASRKLRYHGGTGISVIQEYIANGELDTKAHIRLLKEVDKGKVCALYKAGWNYNAIAQDVMVDEWVVKYVLKQEGLIDG